MGCIYQAKCKITSKSYIGKTVNFKYRKNRHLAERISMPKKHPKFYNALNKYGPDNFEWSILEDNLLTNEQMNEQEKYWIKKLDTLGNGYNCNCGGEGWQAGKDHPKWKGGRRMAQQRYEDTHKKEKKKYAKKYYKEPLSEKDMERFWSLVDKTDSCWNWKGHVSKRNGLVFKMKQARHIMFNKTLDKGSIIVVSCNNDKCINPEHFIIRKWLDLMRERNSKFK